MGVSVKKKELKQAVATVETKHKDGSTESTQEVLGEQVFDSPPANVGLSIGVTRNLGNYESVKFTVSLYMPCIPEESEINQTFDEVKAWVDTKIEQINQEITDQLS